MVSNKKIGKGITFPITINPTGGIDITSGKELVESSMKVILASPKGQSFFLGEFGSRLEELLEEQNGEWLNSAIQYFIFEAIRRWEPRVKVNDTQIISVSRESIKVVVDYTIVTSGFRESFVYPFYKNRLT